MKLYINVNKPDLFQAVVGNTAATQQDDESGMYLDCGVVDDAFQVFAENSYGYRRDACDTENVRLSKNLYKVGCGFDIVEIS